MPLFRNLTTKLRIAISPSSSSASSPTSPQSSSTTTSTSSFEVLGGRKGSNGFIVRREQSAPATRVNSFASMSGETNNASNESVDRSAVPDDRKGRRVSKFREELDFGYE